MTGTPLPPIPSRLTTWKRWKLLFPHTLVLSPKTGYARDYERDPYEGYSSSPFSFFRSRKTPPYLREKELVLGIEIDGHFKAYPLSLLKNLPSPLYESVAGKRIRVYFDKDSQEAYAELASGERVSGIISYWFAWYAFHPDSKVFKSPQ